MRIILPLLLLLPSCRSHRQAVAELQTRQVIILRPSIPDTANGKLVLAAADEAAALAILQGKARAKSQPSWPSRPGILTAAPAGGGGK